MTDGIAIRDIGLRTRAFKRAGGSERSLRRSLWAAIITTKRRAGYRALRGVSDNEIATFLQAEVHSALRVEGVFRTRWAHFSDIRGDALLK